jgi:Sulfotransferase family
MIISHSRKFIFVKTYKTAGSSLEIALSKYCAKGDVLTPLDGGPGGGEERQRRALSGLGAQNYGKPARRYTLEDLARLVRTRRRAERFNEHSAAWQIRRIVGPAVWDGYFKFTIVRNPFDRCLSRFYYSKKVYEDRGREKAWDLEDLDQYMRYNPWFVNENWAMYTQADKVLVDFFVRYEHLEADLAEVSRRLGFGRNVYEDMKAIAAKQGLRPKAAAPSVRLSPAGRRMVELLCAPEIALFGYTADGFAADDAVPDRTADRTAARG